MKNINEIELRELLAANKDVIIIDVRTPDEVKSGMIDGAINYDFFGKEFVNNVKLLDKSKKYVMVCRSGNRSGSACGVMQAHQIGDVYNLTGGMMNWTGETVS